MAQHSLDAASPRGQWSIRPVHASGHAELVVLQACNLDAAEDAIRIVRSRGTVVLNCASMSAELAQRLLDVVRGGLCAIDGCYEPISPQVVLLRPALAPRLS